MNYASCQIMIGCISLILVDYLKVLNLLKVASVIAIR